MSTFVSNEQLIAIQKAQIESLEKQLADIKYLSRDEVINILYDKATYAGIERKTCLTKYEFRAIELNEAIDAICNLAIKVDREKIIEVLNRFLFTDTDNPLEIFSGTATVLTSTGTIADEIIAALEGK